MDSTTGLSPGRNLPADMTAPVAELDTLADIMAACINSPGGAAGDGSVCGSLFTETTEPAQSAPANTVDAFLHLAKNPTLNTANLFTLTTALAPFQPQLAAPPPTFAVALLPKATQGSLTISPSAIAVPGTATGFASAPFAVAYNNSAVGVTLGSFSFSGTNAADFAETSACPPFLAAGTSCTVNVVFTPAAAGSRSGALSFVSDGAGSPQTVALSGNGGAPAAGPITASAPATFTNAGAIQDVTLSNLGTTPLTLRRITSSDPNFLVESNGCGTMLPAQSVCIVP